jgi:FixJ family two-component response regulator
LRWRTIAVVDDGDSVRKAVGRLLQRSAPNRG